MRLLNPSPGEILDRLSILELKIEAATKKGVSSVHFEAEKASLQEVLLGWTRGLSDINNGSKSPTTKLQTIANHINGLAAMNALLWDAEDQVRAASEDEAFKLARLCKNIAKWNDSRSAHVHALNLLYGLESEPEKLYDHKRQDRVTDQELE